MKTKLLIVLATLLATSCQSLLVDVTDDPEAFSVSSPQPKEQLTKVALSDAQKGYVSGANKMAFRFLREMYEGKSLVCSPLSLQYALGMTANGASGETLQEIIDFLGYGSDGIDALNAYCKLLLDQLPALDLNVALKLTDALLVNQDFPLLSTFKTTVRDNYYAAIANMTFDNPNAVAKAINDWAKQNTNGFIDKLMDPEEISPDAVAFLMNALYFKAKWAGSKENPMFREETTVAGSFTDDAGAVSKQKMMNSTGYYRYAEMDGFRVLELPYADRKFCMYFLLPDKRDLKGMLDKLQNVSWGAVLGSMKDDATVSVKIPKFDVENKFYLKEKLEKLGVVRAFQQGGKAQFDRMFEPQAADYNYYISKVIQKARISVAEWGTEAAAVTVVEMSKNAAAPPMGKIVEFYADHPFVFLIGEPVSQTILFEGAFTGK